MKPPKCPAREKKIEARKAKEEMEERNQKEKIKTAVSLLNSKTRNLAFLHMAKLCKLIIVKVDQKAMKRMTCKQPCGKFWLFIAGN